MTDVDAPHACWPVDQSLTGAVGDVDAIAFADQGACLLANGTGIGPRLDQVPPGLFDGLGLVVSTGLIPR